MLLLNMIVENLTFLLMCLTFWSKEPVIALNLIVIWQCTDAQRIWWCTCLQTKLRYMSEDVTAESTIRSTRFVFSTLRPMQRIAMDTIGPLPEVTTFKFIIVFIDTFTRCVELYPANKVCNLGWECAMETHTPVLYTFRDLSWSGYIVYELNTYSPRFYIWHYTPFDDTILERGKWDCLTG